MEKLTHTDRFSKRKKFAITLVAVTTVALGMLTSPSTASAAKSLACSIAEQNLADFTLWAGDPYALGYYIGVYIQACW